MINLNTNLSSQIVQQSMANATKLLNLSVEQMTTGYKLNHAKDNAANYSISTNLTTKIGAYQVAEENVLQGLDMIRTTSESLETMGESLSRLRALAVQAQNGTFGDKSLNAITAEATALINELYRTKSTTEYSGTKLFGSGTDGITNAGKELKLNEQGFLQKVNVRDTSTMAKLKDVDPTTTISSGTYSITTAEELQKLSDMSRAGLITTACEFVLGADIDLKDLPDTQTGQGWMPISGGLITFDGNGYTISNLYINKPGSYYQGLFGKNANTIKNLRLENVAITAGSYSGAISGGYITEGANVTNCTVIGGYVKSNGSNVGGVQGSSYYGQVQHCYANLSVSGVSEVGGIMGQGNYSGVYSSVSAGSVTATGSNVGGILGFGDCSRSSSSMDVSGTTNVGGIMGAINRSISSNYFSGSVIGDTNCGGITGKTTSYSITDSICEGTVSGNSNVGAILGSATGSSTIKNIYYDGSATFGLSVVGSGGYTLTDVVDVSMGTTHMLQVGTNGNWASNLSFNTYISLPGIDKLLDNGITNPDLIKNIDECIDVVARKNTEVGAAENRLLSVLDEIEIQYNNLVSSRSTIMDADISEVSSTYIQQQILQQASATLLATANQTPSIALGLI